MSPAVTPTERENTIIAQFAGLPEWRWWIDVKHLVAGAMNGGEYHEAVNALVDAGRLQRELVPGRGLRLRIAV